MVGDLGWGRAGSPAQSWVRFVQTQGDLQALADGMRSRHTQTGCGVGVILPRPPSWVLLSAIQSWDPRTPPLRAPALRAGSHSSFDLD